MIQIESITLKEFRGIRDLTLDFGCESFVIQGPNGSGKSGVADGIEFAISGNISRLEGQGTNGLTVTGHGPHVDRRDDPASAVVSMNVKLVANGKTAVVTRNAKHPKKYDLVPDDPEIRAAVDELAKHPELTLSRREIIKYIVIEPTKRSEAVQALLRLDRIGKIRSALKTAMTQLSNKRSAAESQHRTAREYLQVHLGVGELNSAAMLAVVNEYRVKLGLRELTSFDRSTNFDDGYTGGISSKNSFDKQTAIKDLAAFQQLLMSLPEVAAQQRQALLTDLQQLESDASIFEALQRRTFIEHGLRLATNEKCPLCDHEWDDVESLVVHLRHKLAKSNQAEALQARLQTHSGILAEEARRVRAAIENVKEIAIFNNDGGLSSSLDAWSNDLQAFASDLAHIEKLASHKARLERNWAAPPEGITEGVISLIATVNELPEESATFQAQKFLLTAQERLTSVRETRRTMQPAVSAHDTAKYAYTAYCSAAETELEKLYISVEDEFSMFYRQINPDDEDGFRASLDASEGKLDLTVDFHGHGMFSPVAYHSEGHQDGMGVCLYLALTKRVLGDMFTFAVLDDVVMSIDKGHRRQFCAMLKQEFPSTQFIITTHERAWANQMQGEGLVKKKRRVDFYGWSVDHGPICESGTDFWEQIDNDLAKDDVSSAAARLRRNMERLSGEWAASLRATVQFSPYGHDLGELLPAALGKYGDLLRLAANAANSWNKAEDMAEVEKLKKQRAEAISEQTAEYWNINSAVHFNEWAELSKQDFLPVVKAMRAIADLFTCSNPECDSWLCLTPGKGTPEVLRCKCATFSMNLVPK